MKELAKLQMALGGGVTLGFVVIGVTVMNYMNFLKENKEDILIALLIAVPVLFFIGFILYYLLRT